MGVVRGEKRRGRVDVTVMKTRACAAQNMNKMGSARLCVIRGNHAGLQARGVSKRAWTHLHEKTLEAQQVLGPTNEVVERAVCASRRRVGEGHGDGEPN